MNGKKDILIETLDNLIEYEADKFVVLTNIKEAIELRDAIIANQKVVIAMQLDQIEELQNKLK